MNSSPSYGDLGARENGDTRGVHNDLHFGGGMAMNQLPPRGYALSTEYQHSIPGEWPTSPPPQQQLNRPPPQQPNQWASQRPTPPALAPGTRPVTDQQNNWLQDDFLDMPEPSTTPIPPPLPARTQENQHWEPGYHPQTAPQQSTYGALDTFPASLSANLPQYNNPPLPPKVPISNQGQFAPSPPPLPPRDHDPYHAPANQYTNSGHDIPPLQYSNSGTFTPASHTPPPQVSTHPATSPNHSIPACLSPPPRPSTGRLSPDLQYNSIPPRHSSHPPAPPPDAFFVPPTQRPPSTPLYHSEQITPPRPDRYSPRPSPPANLGYSPPTRYNQYPPNQQTAFPDAQPQYQQLPVEPYRRTSGPPQFPQAPPYQQPPVDPYRHPSPQFVPPQVQYQQPPIEPYQRPPPAHSPQIEPYHRPSTQGQPDPYRRPSQPTPSKPEWRPTPPPQKPLAGPVISSPPPSILEDLRFLPYSPVRTPTYHRQTIAHPQNFFKTSLLRIMIIPAENTTFIAGSEIYGRMDVICKGDGGSKGGKSDLLIGELGIELLAYDETKSDSGGSPPRCQVFMLSTQKFQTPFDPKAVLDRVTSAIAYPVTIPPDDKGYRQPARGTTIFPFRFQLPQDTGSAVECGEEVRTRYTLTGYAKVRIQGNFETLVQSVEVDMVEQLPYNHIYRNPDYEHKELKVKDTTDKSFRGKLLGIEASIPKSWYKAGDVIPITLVFTPTGYKKVGWIKATLVNRVTIKGKPKEVVIDYAVTEEKLDDETDFDLEKPTHTVKLGLKIPKTCRTVTTGLFEVKPYLKIFVLHNKLGVPFSISLPSIDILHPTSFELDNDDAEAYANLSGGYMVREIDTKGGSGKVINERPGTNRAIGWSWYLDKSGRSKVLSV